MTKQDDPGNLYSKFQKTILRTGQRIKSETGTIRRKGGSASAGGIFRRAGKDRDIFYFVYQHDSLLAWSNNKVILPAELIRQYRGGSFALKLKTGWYVFYGEKDGVFCYLGGYLVKYEFPFQNKYLKNGFSTRFAIPASVSISSAKGRYAVNSPDGRYLFSLGFPGNPGTPGNTHSTLVLVLFILAALCMARFIYIVYIRLEWFAGRRNLLVLCYCTDMIILRLLQFYFRFPGELYSSELFGPSLYSSSVVLPSLGDFTLNMLLVLVLALAYYKNGHFDRERIGKTLFRKITAGTLYLLPGLLMFHAVRYFIADLVNNSAVSLNLQNFSELSPASGFGLFIISAMLVSLWLVLFRIFTGLHSLSGSGRWLVLPVIIAVLTDILVFLISGRNFDYLSVVFFLVFLSLFLYIREKGKNFYSAPYLILFLCFFSVFTTIVLNQAIREKKTEKIKLLAVKLATRRNPVTEVLYEQLETRLLSDMLVKGYLHQNNLQNGIGADSLSKYLKTVYFKGYWRKYSIQITICDPDKSLQIQPQGYLINCNTYFSGIIRNYGEETISPDLVFLDYGFGKEYYIASLSGPKTGNSGDPQKTIYIELNLKNIYPDPGYPGLLIDNARMEAPAMPDYSYGLYQDGRLIYSVGPYSYKAELGQYRGFSTGLTTCSEDRMIHYRYRINHSETLLISQREEDFLAVISPFSYLFLIFTVISLLATLLYHFPHSFIFTTGTLRMRLQVSLIAILVAALLAIGIVQVNNITRINAKKNDDNLRERAYSVLAEIQHKYGEEKDGRDIAKWDPEDFLIKLSNVFFTDINLYDVNGMLISSSRPQIFEEGLVSGRMDPEAFQNLVMGHGTFLIHDETIGRMQYRSAYLPFFNDRNELTGYINLPYFSKQDELKKEISSFLVTFINIYILLFLFGLFITLLISNYFTAPLSLLAEKLSGLKLGGANERIAWKRKDEIGQLVAVYNRMVDELERSAEMLARSERESAWREMARQVAHEIKNPLTPMKLSTQYLQKAWNDKAPDWEQRLQRYTSALVEQIDTLSAIASDFSDFARMPAGAVEKASLDEVIRFVLSIYQANPDIHFEFSSGVQNPVVLADRSQLIRVFTNLFNNAVQAIGERKDGRVEIRLTGDGQHLIISVSDNGEGIPQERYKKIFQPDFTTKTGGTGLGLAIVKGIVEGMKGEISFLSEVRKGTTFVIKLPSYADQKS